MSSPEHNSPQMDADGIIRKRVGRACDRCRLKKSKCDGKMPCSRCKADNNICVFGERKKSQDKVYPKGYVEMLEAQQSWLVNGLQSMYTILDDASIFPGGSLEKEENGRPFTHDMLERVGALPVGEHFDEDCEQLLSQASSVRRSSEHTTATPEQTQAIKQPQASHKRRLEPEHSSRSHSPDTDRSFSPPSRNASLRSSFETVSPRTPPTPASADFRQWKLQIPPHKQQRQSFATFPRQTQTQTKPLPTNNNNNNNGWDYSMPQFSNVDMMWNTDPVSMNGAMIPDLGMDIDLDPITASTNFYDPSLGGQNLVINPVSLSNSIDQADFENFFNSGL